MESDTSLQGVNSKETILTPANVSGPKFAKLFSCPVDAFVFAQPLYVANLVIPGNGTHNVVFVATEKDSLYAFDADSSACSAVWPAAKVSLLGAGEVPPTGGDVSSSNIGPTVGITGTPVIDPVAKTLFAVATSKNSGGAIIQRLHAIDITTGLERPSSPIPISAHVTGSGSGSSGGQISFDPKRNNQRPGLLLANGVVYITWASHDDVPIYHGWVIGYNSTTLLQVAAFSPTPSGATNGGLEGGIWMSGAAPSADANGKIYLAVGNGTFDNTSSAIPPISPNNDFGDSVLKLSTASNSIAVTDFFTPFDENNLNTNDIDLGSTGIALLPDQPGTPAHLAICGGKSGKIYLINRDNLGQFHSGSDAVVQVFPLSGNTGNGFRSTPAFFNNTMYAAGQGDPLMAVTFDPALKKFANPQIPTSQSAAIYQGYGTSPFISAQGTTNGIVWTIDVGPEAGTPAVRAILRAHDATDLTKLLYRSDAVAGDAAGLAVKFTVPVVANGKVYVGTQTRLDVYGLLP